jgi:glycosyltransferase involved in cell wall biosynthesis
MSNVSVVLITRDGGRHIRRQLETLQQQTLAPAELVVIDDGSTDDTAEIVAAFASNAPFPVTFRQNSETRCMAGSFLAAALARTSVYVAICDQGDEWHEEKLLSCVSALDRNQALLCAHSLTLIDRNSQYVGFLSQGITRGKTYEPLTLPPFGSFLPFSQVFRRSLLDLVPAENSAGDRRSDLDMLQPWLYCLTTSLGNTVTLAQPLVARRQEGPIPPPMRRTLVGWAGNRRQDPRDVLRRQKAAAEERALLMEGIAKDATGEFASQADHAGRYWRLLANTLSAQVDPYEASSLPARLGRSRRAVSKQNETSRP